MAGSGKIIYRQISDFVFYRGNGLSAISNTQVARRRFALGMGIPDSVSLCMAGDQGDGCTGGYSRPSFTGHPERRSKFRKVKRAVQITWLTCDVCIALTSWALLVGLSIYWVFK